MTSDVTRFFMHSRQFQGDVYRLFVAAMTACKQGRETFHNSANQKYFLRQIKAMDKAVTGKAIVGAASLTAKDEDGGTYIPKEFDLNLLILYGHMLAAGKSYIPALSKEFAMEQLSTRVKANNCRLLCACIFNRT